MATTGIQEATPLVYRGTMFVPNPSDVTQALNGATGERLWEYRRPVPPDLTQYLSGSPLKNRNLAIYEDKIFMPVQNTCAVEAATADTIPAAGVPSPYMIRRQQQLSPGVSHVGTIHAVAVQTGKTLWTFNSAAGVLSLMATGGGLVFGGDAAGNFRAFDQDTGRVRWETNLGSPVNGFPITYSANGRQYVAVSTGTSLVSSGVSRLAREQAPSTANTLFAFALP
jgi:outer membrane protein assembly factor BamB